MINKFKNKIKRLLNNEYKRIDWVQEELLKIKDGSTILDAGCGSQQYRKFCDHLIYYGQDFGNYRTDETESFTASDVPYIYGKLDYQGNIWDINPNNSIEINKSV